MEKTFKVLVEINIWLLTALVTIHTFHIRSLEKKTAELSENDVSNLRWLNEIDHRLISIEKGTDDGK